MATPSGAATRLLGRTAEVWRRLQIEAHKVAASGNGYGTERAYLSKSLNRSTHLPHLRRSLAAAVGYAARKLWRRKDLEEIAEVVLNLLMEAVQRMGRKYGPSEGLGADQALAQAPRHTQQLVNRIEPIAHRQAPLTVVTPCRLEHAEAEDKNKNNSQYQWCYELAPQGLSKENKTASLVDSQRCIRTKVLESAKQYR